MRIKFVKIHELLPRISPLVLSEIPSATLSKTGVSGPRTEDRAGKRDIRDDGAKALQPL